MHQWQLMHYRQRKSPASRQFKTKNYLNLFARSFSCHEPVDPVMSLSNE